MVSESVMVVGLTGGIGSGKSAAADRFARRGVTVVDADECSRTVVEPGSEALAAIVRHFGKQVLQPEGSLDRARLREAVFADEAQRHWLEELLHPLIGEEIAGQLRAATSPYALLMSPLLLETRQHEQCDCIIVVDVPEQVQRERTLARDGVSEEQVRSIMQAQMSRQDRQDRRGESGFVLENNGSLRQLDAAVDELHQKLQSRAKK